MRRTLKICSSCADLQQVVPEAFDFRLVTEQFERYIYRYFAGYPTLAGFNLEEDSASLIRQMGRSRLPPLISTFVAVTLSSSAVVHKPSPPAVAEKPTVVQPSVPRSDAAAVAPVELPAVSPAEPASPHAMADNLLKPLESQPKAQPSQQPVVTTDQTPPVVDVNGLVDPATRELITRGWALYDQPYSLVRWQEARRDFEHAVEMDPGSSEASIGLASILSTK